MRVLSALLQFGTSGTSVRASRFAPTLAILAALMLGAASFVAHADDDLPGRVGRVAEYAGQLYQSTQERGAEWTAIGINYPVTSGDNLWVSGDGRAEIDYGGGQFRLSGETNLHISRLDDRQLTLFVARGQVIVRVRVLDTGDAAVVDTPSTQVALVRPGLYRIEVSPDGQATTLTVREGEAVLGLANGAQQVLPGQWVAVAGTDPVAADLRYSPPLDGFDAWNANRDRRYERGRSTAYVSKQMVGYAELDEHGTWENNASYGPVWYPTAVPVDWTPYRDGYWTNAGAWGLTWVDAAPWGYAPSHYGRWVRVGPRWAWCPGAYVARPYWAPALVGWYGGAGWGLTAGGGAPVYGWVPLGWGDAYHPWWGGCSNRCWTRYNQPYAVNVAVRPNVAATRYSHLAVPGAMTAVAGATLIARRPVAPNMVQVPASQATSAPLLATAPTVAPGQTHSPVFRPGERGTPTPASMLPSYARSGPARSAPASSPAGVPAPATVSLPAAGGFSGAPTMSRPAAAPPPTQLPVQPPRRVLPPGPQLPAAGSAQAASNPSVNVGSAGVPMPATMAPATRAAPAPAVGQPLPAVVAPVAVPTQAAPQDRGHPKHNDDADAGKASKGGDRNPGAGPAPAQR